MVVFPVSVSYSQIAAFNGDLENPFNEWTDQHVAQGFSWRPGSVSFKTLIEAGQTCVEVRIANEMPAPSGVRAITVPFSCPDAGKVEIASIADGQTYKIPPGEYQLLFETGNSDKGNWCRFTFIRNAVKLPQILLSDEEIIPSSSLLMHAEPA